MFVGGSASFFGAGNSFVSVFGEHGEQVNTFHIFRNSCWAGDGAFFVPAEQVIGSSLVFRRGRQYVRHLDRRRRSSFWSASLCHRLVYHACMPNMKLFPCCSAACAVCSGTGSAHLYSHIMAAIFQTTLWDVQAYLRTLCTHLYVVNFLLQQLLKRPNFLDTLFEFSPS